MRWRRLGRLELEKYVGQYQVTGAPIMITVTAVGGKLAVEVSDRARPSWQLVSGEDYSLKGSPITVRRFSKGEARRQGDGNDDSPGAGY